MVIRFTRNSVRKDGLKRDLYNQSNKEKTMPRIIRISIAAALFSIALTPGAYSCLLKISHGQESPKHETTDVITVQFIQIHRNCAVKPDATKFETEGIKIINSSGWVTVRDNVYERSFEVEYAKAGTAVFRATRTCAKKGEQSKSLELQVR
jgi:hypothetical protein